MGSAIPESLIYNTSLQNFACFSVAESRLTISNPMDYSMPGSSILHYLLEFAQMTIESVMLSNHLSLCCPLLLLPSIFPSIRVFPMSHLFTLSGQSIGDQFQHQAFQLIFRLTSFRIDWLIFLQSKGCSRLFSSTAIQKQQFFGS